MAVLTQDEKFKIMKRAERKAYASDIPVRWVKQALIDVMQEIDDAVDGDIPIVRGEVAPGAGTGFHLVVSARVDAVATTHGLIFTNAEKKWLFAFVMEQKYERDK